MTTDAADEDNKIEIATLVVDILHTEVAAGDELILRAAATCTPASDLRGQSLLIKDQDGALIDTLEFVEFDGQTNETDDIAVKAPGKPGQYTWSAVCPEASEGTPHAEASTTFSFTVTAHTTTMLVWDVPSALVVGEKFTVKVGIRCSGACKLTGREFTIVDHTGKQLATGKLGEEPRKGTTALYFCEVDLVAADTEGVHKWKAEAQWTDLQPAHEACTATFGVRFAPPPECVVKVEAVDKKTLAAVAGAQVVMHPYRAVTDERGVAEVKLPKGAYTILVSRAKYDPMRKDVEVTGDVETQVELEAEAADFNPDDMY